MKILLVDDVLLERTQLAIQLQQFGHCVEVAGSGHQALELFPIIEPDLLILDVSMPIMNGFEVSIHIRNLYPQWIPIIF